MGTRNMHDTAEKSTSGWLVVLFVAAVAVVALTMYHTVTPAAASVEPAGTLAAVQLESEVQPFQPSSSVSHDSCDGACDTEHQIFDTSCVLTMLLSWSLFDVAVSQQSVQVISRASHFVPSNMTACVTPGDRAPSLPQLSISRT
ncbi:hypothetical protein [Paramicrobacterium agarici]|uniref:hypothetical protein n=1 Tax=Paramicrobacterium agarici TaxID=630514 RepID=UPI0011505525|nr:hypothetical protein [Microbacterium agarici]TQO22255.1 hypothetical protein FB385_1081 [Microbacterium agarici]